MKMSISNFEQFQIWMSNLGKWERAFVSSFSMAVILCGTMMIFCFIYNKFGTPATMICFGVFLIVKFFILCILGIPELALITSSIFGALMIMLVSCLSE